ncbi:hypothetical protein ACHAXM_001619 [Skeletonema potamos]
MRFRLHHLHGLMTELSCRVLALVAGAPL